MALRNGSSDGIVLVDIINTVKEFEAQNTVRIRMKGELVTHRGQKDIVWVAEAYSNQIEQSGVLPLACASVRCLEQRLTTMESVIFQLLYALDFQLAELEMYGKREA